MREAPPLTRVVTPLMMVVLGGLVEVGLGPPQALMTTEG